MKSVIFFFSIFLLIGVAVAEPYAIYDPDGDTGKPKISFYGGEITDPVYLSSHIINLHVNTSEYWTAQDIFVPYEDGYKFNNTYYFFFNTGNYSFRNKSTYFQSNGVNYPMKFEGGTNPVARYTFQDCKIAGIDQNISLATGYIDSNFTNTTFVKFDTIGVYDSPARRYLPFTVANCNFYDGNNQLSFNYRTGFNNATFHDLYYENCQGLFFSVANCTNSTAYNVSTVGCLPDDSGTGFFFDGVSTSTNYGTVFGGHDNRVWNITLDGAGRSGFDLSMHQYNFTGDTIWVNKSGHNGVDLHGQWNVTLTNVTVMNSRLEEFMITSPDSSLGDAYIHNKAGAVNVRATTTVSHDMYINNLYMQAGPTTGSELSLNRFVNVTFENVTVEKALKTGTINYGEDLTIINMSSNNMTSNVGITLGTAGDYGYCNDTKLVDCSFTSSTYNPYICSYASRNLSLVNVYAEAGIKKQNPFPYNWTYYYYPNIKVVDESGTPLQNAVVTLSAVGRNGRGVTQTTSYTDENGTLYDHGNRSNWLAVPDYKNDNGVISYYNTTVTATFGGDSYSIIANPDATWYSSNPADLQGPLTLIGPGITGTPPISNFIATPVSGKVPLVVSFTDLSASAEAWEWDFNNDGTVDSTEQNPTCNYTQVGVYAVKLNTTNENGYDVETKTSYITVTRPSPVTTIPSTISQIWWYLRSWVEWGDY